MKKQKRIMPPGVHLYFTGRGVHLKPKLEALAKKHDMSVSAVAGLAIRAGLPQVEKSLEGLLPAKGNSEQTPHL